MKLLLLFVAAQLAGNGITLLIAALLARVLRRCLVAARPSIGSYASAHDPTDDDAELDIATTVRTVRLLPRRKRCPMLGFACCMVLVAFFSWLSNPPTAGD